MLKSAVWRDILKNKPELVRLLESQENPLDQPVPDINVPVLTPQLLSRVQRFKEYAADKRQIFKKICKLQME